MMYTAQTIQGFKDLYRRDVLEGAHRLVTVISGVVPTLRQPQRESTSCRCLRVHHRLHLSKSSSNLQSTPTLCEDLSISTYPYRQHYRSIKGGLPIALILKNILSRSNTGTPTLQSPGQDQTSINHLQPLSRIRLNATTLALPE